MWLGGVVILKLLSLLAQIGMCLIMVFLVGYLMLTISIGFYDGYNKDDILNAAIEYEESSGQPLTQLAALIEPYDDMNGNYHKPLLRRLNIEKYLIDTDNKLITYKDYEPIFYGGPTFKINKLLYKYNLSINELIPMQTISKADAFDLIKSLSNGQSLYFEAYKINPPFKDKDSIILVFKNNLGEKELVTVRDISNNISYINYFDSIIYTKEYSSPVIKITKDNITLHIEIRLPDSYLELSVNQVRTSDASV